MRRFTTRYDHDLTEELMKPSRQMQAIFKSLPQWRQDLAHHRAGATNRKRAAKISAVKGVDKARQAREEIELEAAATLRKCVEALEQALEAVHNVPAPAKYQSHFNVRAVTDIVYIMRKKMKV